MPELGKQCLKHVGMRGWAGPPLADVVMANDRAGWPARTLGGSPGAHITTHPGPPPAFWEVSGLFAVASELLDEKNLIRYNHLCLHQECPCSSPAGSAKSTGVELGLAGK